MITQLANFKLTSQFFNILLSWTESMCLFKLYSLEFFISKPNSWTFALFWFHELYAKWFFRFGKVKTVIRGKDLFLHLVKSWQKHANVSKHNYFKTYISLSGISTWFFKSLFVEGEDCQRNLYHILHGFTLLSLMIQFHRICADHDQSCTDAEIARSELFNSVFSAKELFHPFKHEPNISLTGYESKYRHFFRKNMYPA